MPNYMLKQSNFCRNSTWLWAAGSR